MANLIIEGAGCDEESLYWSQVRVQSAIAAMQSLITVHQQPRPELIVPQSIKFANAIVKELQNDQSHQPGRTTG